MTEAVPAPRAERAWSERVSRRTRSARRRAVAFPELALVHLRWRQALETNASELGQLELQYSAALAAFEDEQGRIVNAYWCSSVPSAVALTVKPAHWLLRLLRKPPALRFHRVSDWATKDDSEVAGLLHQCDTLAVKAAEVLRQSTQRICMQLIMASAGHVLSLADAPSAHQTKKDKDQALRNERRVLADTRRYYEEVALREGQIVYFWGMIIGLAAVVALILAVWSFAGGVLNDNQFVASSIAGALGALTSVMMRMTRKDDTFTVDPELGRASLRRFGSFRPFLGATAGLTLYFALESGVLNIEFGEYEAETYLYALMAFAAGFSERLAKDVLDAAELTVMSVVRAERTTSTVEAPGSSSPPRPID